MLQIEYIVRDIILPTKVYIVKPMVFPVVMHGCESCTIKKAEHWGIAFELWSWRRLLRGEIKPVSPKRNQPWIFIGRSDMELKLQYFGYLMQRANSLEKTLVLGKIGNKRIKGRQRMRWLNSSTVSTEMNLSILQEIVEDRGAWHGIVHRVTKSWTLHSNRTTRKRLLFIFSVLYIKYENLNNIK